MSFNAEKKFGHPKHHIDAVDFVEHVSPDVAFIAEAFLEGERSGAPEASIHRLERLGYRVTASLTDTTEQRSDRTGFFGLVSAESGGWGRVVDSGLRRGFLAHIADTESSSLVRIVGTHLDDRSEEHRLVQALRLPEDVDVIMGDLNAMHEEDVLPTILRAMRPITDRLTTKFEVDPSLSKANRLDAAVSLAQRLARMANGATLRELEEGHRNMRDADPSHQPTMHGIANLDHIMVAPRIAVSDFTVHKGIKWSDHDPISATLTVK